MLQRVLMKFGDEQAIFRKLLLFTEI